MSDELPEDDSSGATAGGFVEDEDEAILAAHEQFADELKHHVDERLANGTDRSLISDYISDGLLVSALKMIQRDADYPMDQGRFWQILDQLLVDATNATVSKTDAHLQQEVEAQFAAARNETFEDGFNSSLSFELYRLVLRYANDAVAAISGTILSERVSPDVVAEALRCLGQMQNTATYDARRQLLERALQCSSHVVRDAAVIGLADLNDPHSVSSLEEAASCEQYKLLRSNMLQLLARLRGGKQ
jgi:HEAT repeat protein